MVAPVGHCTTSLTWESDWTLLLCLFGGGWGGGVGGDSCPFITAVTLFCDDNDVIERTVARCSIETD